MKARHFSDAAVAIDKEIRQVRPDPFVRQLGVTFSSGCSLPTFMLEECLQQ